MKTITKTYLFVFFLLALCACKKEKTTCVHNSSLEGEPRYTPTTKNEILANMTGKWFLHRIQCGWGHEEKVNDCVRVCFGANRTFSTYKNGAIIEEDTYNIIESAYQPGLLSIEAQNSFYLKGNISLDGSSTVMSCGSLSADGCNFVFKKE